MVGKITVISGSNDLATTHPVLAKEWHPTKNHPLKPNEVFSGSASRFWWKCKSGHEWEAQLHSRVSRGSGCRICAGQAPDVGKNDLATTDPVLASQWNKTLNTLKPTEVMRFSAKKIWWTCPLGHDFLAAVYNRSKGDGCPFCSGKQLLKGFNDLQTLNPNLAREWHPKKNGKTASEVRAADGTPWWWVCELGHEFQSTRKAGRGDCPYCTAKVLLKGTNDLAAVFPELMSWWDTKKNLVSPDQVIRTSTATFHWICPKAGHSFQQTVYGRRKGAGCPVCVGKAIEKGVNDLASQNPFLASQWSYEKNTIQPVSITSKSQKRVWWKCPLGHEWEATVKNRSNGDGCPYCGNRKLLKGFNDVASVLPRLVQEWDLVANGGISPDEVCVGEDSDKAWRCSEGHTWTTRIRHRLSGTGCRVCAGQEVDPGKTDLATTHPLLAAEWHPSKNLPLTPRDVIAGTSKKIWWQCPQGHQWKTSGNSRVGNGTGCPSCAKPGYDPTKPGVLYFIKHHELASNKVGITGKDQNRLTNFQNEGWVVIQTWESDGTTIAEAETLFFSWLRKELGIPAFLGMEEMRRTGGFSETFDAYSLSDREVIGKIIEILQRV